jgi:hypothetical protein
MFFANPFAAQAEDASLPAADDDGPEHGKVNTPDPGPVDPGHYEIEASYSGALAKHTWNDQSNLIGHGAEQTNQAGLLLTAGAVENLDFSIFDSYRWLKDKEDAPDSETGNQLGNVTVNGRYRFIENKDLNLEAAYIGGFTAPAGSQSDEKDVSTNQSFWSFDQTLVAAKDWGQWTGNVDAGYALPFGNHLGTARGTANADIAGGYQILAWLQPEVEINYIRNFLSVGGDQEVLAVTMGLVMPIDERLRIDTGLQQGVWGTNADRATTFSIAFKTAF